MGGKHQAGSKAVPRGGLAPPGLKAHTASGTEQTATGSAQGFWNYSVRMSRSFSSRQRKAVYTRGKAVYTDSSQTVLSLVVTPRAFTNPDAN